MTIPKLLEALELTGTVVTIDAMGCQREIAAKIVEKKADFVLALKGNQGLLAEQVKDSFALLPADSVSTEVDCGHGRVEQRICSVIGDLRAFLPLPYSAEIISVRLFFKEKPHAQLPAPLHLWEKCSSLIEKAAEWNSLACLVKIEAERFHKASGKTERETRYYISSLRPDAARINAVIGQHWGIESKLHWWLDVAFGEDHSRKRAGNSAQNFSVVAKIALNLLKQEKSSTRGIKGKRLKAAWSQDYLAKLLGI